MKFLRDQEVVRMSDLKRSSTGHMTNLFLSTGLTDTCDTIFFNKCKGFILFSRTRSR